MNKKVLKWIIVFIPVLLVLLIRIGSWCQNGSPRKPSVPRNRVDGLFDENDHTNEMQDVSKTQKPAAYKSEVQHEKFHECIAYLKEKEAQGLPVGDDPEEGMVDRELLIQRSFLKSRTTSNTNRAPYIVLIDDVYIVSLWRHSNPFRIGEPGFDLRIGFDAWTGELILSLSGGGGVGILNVNKETGAGRVGETPKAKRYQQRVFDRLEKLELDIFYGRSWGLEPKANMIKPEQAVSMAKKQVVKRKYDREKEPFTVLVDDLYIVTFWDIDADKLTERSKAYDSRVGIDAYSGEYVAMETTREDRISQAKKTE